MVFLKYTPACRECLQAEANPHIYKVNDGDLDEYQNKTEFEVMRMLEVWRKQENKTCVFCKSKNIQILDVWVDNYKLYDYYRLVKRCIDEDEQMLQIYLKEEGTFGNLPSVGGSEHLEREFLKLALEKTIELINDSPEDIFERKFIGDFFICITGYYHYRLNQTITNIESFRTAGIPKSIIFNSIKLIGNANGLKFGL